MFLIDVHLDHIPRPIYKRTALHWTFGRCGHFCMDQEKERDGCRISDMTWFVKRHTRPYLRRSENWTIEKVRKPFEKKTDELCAKDLADSRAAGTKGAFRVKLKFSLLLLLLFTPFCFYCCTLPLYWTQVREFSTEMCYIFTPFLSDEWLVITRPRFKREKQAKSYV